MAADLSYVIHRNRTGVFEDTEPPQEPPTPIPATPPPDEAVDLEWRVKPQVPVRYRRETWRNLSVPG